MSTRIQLRRGTAAGWTAVNPVLADGELGVELADGVAPDRVKIGDGVTAWTALPYSFDTPSGIPLGEKGVALGVATLDGAGVVPLAQLPDQAALDAEIAVAVAAEAVVRAAALAAHTAETTTVHGIADTSVLATDAELAAAISTHVGLADPHPGYATDGDLSGHAADTSTHGFADGAVLETTTHIIASGKGFVNHGTTAGMARPTGYASVEWYGSVEPANAIPGDTWVDTL